MAAVDESDAVVALALVVALARIARTDRDLYRILRAEAWAYVQAAHENHTDEQRGAWQQSAS